jgi:hypothetical protein
VWEATVLALLLVRLHSLYHLLMFLVKLAACSFFPGDNPGYLLPGDNPGHLFPGDNPGDNYR